MNNLLYAEPISNNDLLFMPDIYKYQHCVNNTCIDFPVLSKKSQ